MTTDTRPARCAEIVPDGMMMRRCRRPAGHGREGAYCHQHAALLARIRRNLRRATSREG